MNKQKIIITFFIIALGVYGGLILWRSDRLTKDYSVFVVCGDCPTQGERNVRSAYESVLREEGIPYRLVDAPWLLGFHPAAAVEMTPAIILPDAISQKLPSDMAFWIEAYIRAGGRALVVFDPGIRDQRGHFLKKPLFADLVQVNYLQYQALREKSYGDGYFKFKDSASARAFEIPPGKASQGVLLSGYAYGSLTYPMARTLADPRLEDRDVYAYAEIGNTRFPGLVQRSIGKGSVMYVNLSLGVLKGFSDDLPLRVILRSFLLRTVGILHMLNAPGGQGGLVINWHIDSSIDWKSIPAMIDRKYLRQGMDYSLHITAGDFRDAPGDGLGFDAGGKGAPFIRMLRPYGVIGSHGGWAHNWFAEQLSSNTLSEQEITQYVNKNNETLSHITGTKIDEYSAPRGVHPQPILTRVLERLGMGSYYYTGDCGSSPNRTFINGVMVSTSVIAFPILPFGKEASLHEMKVTGVPEPEVAAWLRGIVDYIVDHRTVRLFYSHPYDMYDYPRALKEFLDYAERRQSEGSVRVRSMSYFAAFLQRFIRTSSLFTRVPGGMTAIVSNPEGIFDMTLAIPRSRFMRPPSGAGSIHEDEEYYYLTFISTTATTATLNLIEGRS